MTFTFFNPISRQILIVDNNESSHLGIKWQPQMVYNKDINLGQYHEGLYLSLVSINMLTKEQL